jgi:hypothetical protein
MRRRFMKKYGTKTEFILGLIGVIIHTFVVSFIVAYLVNPDMLTLVIETTTGSEQELLIQFQNEIQRLDIIIYAGTAIVIFEWIGVFKNLKYTNNRTPIWGTFLILGALYSFFYFGGIEPFILLLLSGLISIIKYVKYTNSLSK